MNENMTINTIPALTWNWLKMNSANVSDDLKGEIIFKNTKYEILSQPDGVTITEGGAFKTNLLSPKSAVFDMPKDTGVQYKPLADEKMNPNAGAFGTKLAPLWETAFADGISADGEKTEPLGETNRSAGDTETEEVNSLLIETSKKIPAPVVINFTASGKSHTSQIIHALPDSEIAVVLVTESGTDSGIDFIRTTCIAEENAKINLYKVQLLGNNFYRIDSTESVCAKNANVTYTELQLGAKSIYTGAYTLLQEYKSSYKSDTAYYREKNQKIDMNYVCCHKGKKSECSMAVNGSLIDESQKTYRGTIDFKNGCSGSKGNESEETLLLSPKVVNKSIPIILCDEEDVEGEHGATIGRLSEDVLFYMNSRGISEEEATKIMSKAKVQAVADKIPDEKTQEKIHEFMKKTDSNYPENI